MAAGELQIAVSLGLNDYDLTVRLCEAQRCDRKAINDRNHQHWHAAMHFASDTRQRPATRESPPITAKYTMSSARQRGATPTVDRVGK